MATKEEKQRKQFAEKLLRIKGVNYDEWLDEKHKAVIQENQDLVMMALESVLDNGSSQQSLNINAKDEKENDTDLKEDLNRNNNLQETY